MLFLTQENYQKFEKWMSSKNIPTRPGKGQYQLVQVKLDTGWYPIFKKGDGTISLSDNFKALIHSFNLELNETDTVSGQLEYAKNVLKRIAKNKQSSMMVGEGSRAYCQRAEWAEEALEKLGGF